MKIWLFTAPAVVATTSGFEAHGQTKPQPNYLENLSCSLITDRRWSIAGEVRVGDVLDLAIAKLGRAGEKKGDMVSWSGNTDSIRLRTSGDVITGIVYECYTG